MAKGTGIPWADNTFNTHHGCVEVSPECDHCYAREFDARLGHSHWGKDAPRRFFNDAHWDEPLRWNRAAERGAVGKDGKRILVFVDSMSDLFEAREDLDPVRARFWDLCRRCRALTFLLLTKRPQNLGRMVPPDMHGASNIWYGTTVGLPESLWRASALIEHAGHAPVRWLSMEPLLAETSIGEYLSSPSAPPVPPTWSGIQGDGRRRRGIDWCVAGSESSDGARPMNTDWIRLIRDECFAAGVPFFAKQADASADGVATCAAVGTPQLLDRPNAPYKRRDLRTGPDGMKRVHWIVERPFIDGKQHVNWPKAACP